MHELATTRLSTKGQVVIPEEVRTALGLEPGASFVVLGEADIVILKRIDPPSPREIRALAARARRRAKQAGVRAADVHLAIRDVRRRG